MTSNTRKDYMLTVQTRYFKAEKEEKSSILDEICSNLSIHRKSAIRRINHPRESDKSRPSSSHPIYSKKVIWIIEELWKLAEYPCGIILKAVIPIWLPFLKSRFPINPSIENLLLNISSSTLDRRLRDKKKLLKGKLYGKTKPGLLLRSQIPIKTSSLNISSPGSLEIDLVCHCGVNSASGEFVSTLNAVDIHSTWVERRAVLGKGEIGVQKSVDSIRTSIPFPIKDIDFDNGSEFVNYHLIKYCDLNHIGYTRSRPYCKDDQAHIEQKNSTHVRRIFGHVRLDKLSVVLLMNDLYQNELRLFHNFFKPSQKLLSKKFVGSKVIRKFLPPQTPYQRLLKSNVLSSEQRLKLRRLFLSLNPIHLQKIVHQKINNIFKEQQKPCTLLTSLKTPGPDIRPSTNLPSMTEPVCQRSAQPNSQKPSDNGAINTNSPSKTNTSVSTKRLSSSMISNGHSSAHNTQQRVVQSIKNLYPKKINERLNL